MYDNIDIDHGIGIEAIKLWLDSLKGDRPGDYPHEAILDALNVIMRNNLAEFGAYIKRLQRRELRVKRPKCICPPPNL
jgi:hypothetical protein